MEYLLLLLIAETLEAYTQRSDTLLGVLQKLYSYYKKNIFYFFLMQPSFYIIILIALQTDTLNMSMIFLLSLKIFDIFYKIELIQKVFIEQKISNELATMLEWEIPSWFFLFGILIYVPLLYVALL